MSRVPRVTCNEDMDTNNFGDVMENNIEIWDNEAQIGMNKHNSLSV